MANPAQTGRSLAVATIGPRRARASATGRAAPRAFDSIGSASGPPALVAALLRACGYVPATELAPLTAEAAALQSQIVAAQAQVATLNTQVAALQGQLAAANSANASLASQLGTLNGQIASAQSTLVGLQTQLAGLTPTLNQDNAQVQSLQSQVNSLTASLAGFTATLQDDVNNVIPGLQSELQGLQGKLVSLQATLAGLTAAGGPLAMIQAQLQSDTSAYNGFLGTFQGLQTKVQAYDTVSLPSSLPGLNSLPNYSDMDYKGGPNDPGSGPYDPPFAGFAPYPAQFAIPDFALVTGGGPSAHAVPRFSTASSPFSLSSLRPVPRAASLWAYVPSSGVTTEQGQVSSLQSSLASLSAQAGALTSQAQSLQGQVASATSQQSSVTGQVAAAQTALGGLNSQIASATTAIAGAESAILADIASVPALTNQAASLTSQISAIQNAPTGAAATTSGTPTNLPTANAVIASLNASIASIQSASNPGSIPSVQTAIGNVNAQIQSLTLQDGKVQQDIATLNQEIPTWQGYLAQLAAGGLPVSVAWSFGDGTSATSTGSTATAGGSLGDLWGGVYPNHTYQSPGSYYPTATVSVTRPDGVVFSMPFPLLGLLVGLWPTTISVGGGGAKTSGTATWTITDANNNPVSGARLAVTSKNAAGYRNGFQVVTTNAAGQGSVGYYGAGTANAICLRNPTVHQQTGLAEA